ncbi:hypothetical protein HNV08_09990 [Winogradskyella eckloniae]|uniref:hypothetical protein n=1 Tax=Winogradskyella eckloniae TaxID=1089306 RepID=UPI0015653DFF|nr:hypothetical protein [Winogradskyella eckloniae]NRD20377.1 hypothetical protein [Winogradskyella eckloniae]
MSNIIQYEGIKLWVDQDVIHCKINPDFFKSYNRIRTEKALFNAITFLYDKKYMPFLIDMKQLRGTHAVEIFMLISKSVPINTLVISRVFLVRTTSLNVILALNNITNKRVVPNRIYTDSNLALRYCHKDYQFFYNVS